MELFEKCMQVRSVPLDVFIPSYIENWLGKKERKVCVVGWTNDSSSSIVKNCDDLMIFDSITAHLRSLVRQILKGTL